jgi:hypothetical protein
MADICARCRFWMPYPPWVRETAPEGKCRRHSPRETIGPAMALWPSTAPDSWCGDFEPPMSAPQHSEKP